MSDHSGARATAIRSSRFLRRTILRYREAILFLCIGVLSYAIDAGLLLVLAGPERLPIWLAASLGFWASTIANFLLNRAVFGSSQQGRILAHGARYAILLALNYGITLLGLSVAESAGIHLLPAKTALVALAAVWNFFLYRHWVYR